MFNSKLILIISFLFLLYVSFRYIQHKKENSFSLEREIKNILLFGSVLFIYFLTVYPFPFTFQIPDNIPFNLYPFDTIYLMIHHPYPFIMIMNIFGNILLFMPLGFSLRYRFEEVTTLSTITIGFATSISIEIIQLLIPLRSFDVDDILLNTIGMIIGGLLLAIMKRLKVL